MTQTESRENNKLVIDAKNQVLGRISSEAALWLMGKGSSTFERHKKYKKEVEIINAGKVKITGAKLAQKSYKRYSGYHSGLHKTSMQKVFSKNPADIIKKAIWGMLPKNKLRKVIIKNLKITN